MFERKKKMCNKDLKKLIKEFKNQNMQNYSLLYEEFERLILYYSKKLHTDDAVEEMTLFFIELVTEIDLNKFKNDLSVSLQSYIAVCIRNKFISLSVAEKRQKELRADFFEQTMGYSLEFDKRISIFSALKILPEQQRKVLIYKYVYLYNDVEIAEILNITRQAVNRLKNRGLSNLRIFLGDN